MGGKKEINIGIADVADGLNTVDPDSEVGAKYTGRGRNQVIDCLDIMLHTKRQRPGSNGQSGVFSQYCRGVGTYLKHDGTEYLLSVSGGKLYRHTTIDPPFTKAELFNMTGDGEAWFADYRDICVVCNGTNVVKVEGTVAYQLGIDAPSGASVAAVAGGSLADGTYNVYAGYARKVSGSNVLYSRGESLGEVTLSGGDNTIRVTIPDSSDGQVNNKVVWMTDAGGTTYYFYGETDNNTSASIDIADATDKNTALLYSAQAQRNYDVPAFEYILFHNGYLYGSVENTLYRSLRAGSRYDLERFDTRSIGNNAEYPYEIQGIYALGQDVYLNTPGGIIRVPGGDIDAEYDEIPGYFKYPRTVQPWNGGLIGLTLQGLFFFDGTKMLPYDLAQDVKPQIQRIYDGYSANFRPCAAIYRRDNRLEYHLSYKDNTVSTTHHNRRLVLNLDTVQFLQESRVAAAWELWSNGAAYMAVSNDNVWYCVQHTNTDGCMYKEHTSAKRDQNIYKVGTLETDQEYGFTMQLGRFIPDIRGITRWDRARLYAAYSAPITITVDASEWPDNAINAQTLNAVSDGSPRYGVARYGVDRYAPEGPIHKKTGLSRALKSKGVRVTISQTGEDKTLQLYEVHIHGVLTISRFT